MKKLIAIISLLLLVIALLVAVWFIAVSSYSDNFTSEFYDATITHMDIGGRRHSRDYIMSVVYGDGESGIICVEKSEYAKHSVGDTIRIEIICGYTKNGELNNSYTILNNGESLVDSYRTSFIFHFIEVLLCGLIIVGVVGLIVLLVCCLP